MEDSCVAGKGHFADTFTLHVFFKKMSELANNRASSSSSKVVGIAGKAVKTPSPWSVTVNKPTEQMIKSVFKH